MINEFLGPRLDFILFVQALCLFFLAVFSLDQARRRRSLRWLWLALFGAAQALGIALYLVSQASVEGEAFKHAGWSLHALAAFFLGLFGLHSLPLGRTRAAGFMGAGLLLVLPAAGAAIWGAPGFVLAVRLGLGPAAGLLALAGLGAPAWRENAPPSGSLRALLAAYLFGAEVLPGLHVLARLARNGAGSLHENLPPLFYAVLLAAAAACAATVFARTLVSEAEPAPGRRRGLHAYAIGLVAVAFAVFMGCTVTDSLGHQAERTLHDELFMRVAAVGNAIDPDLVAQLRGDPADLAAPHYLQLLRQLTKIRLGNPDLRFVYITALRLPERAVIISLDTEPPSSEDYVPPGEPYPEAPEELKAIFSSGKAALAGPYEDRWGNWISGFAPVKGPTGAILGVLGMDVAAGAVKAMVASTRLVGIVITFLLAVIGAGLGLVIQRNQDLAAANRLLAAEIAERAQAEDELRQSEARYRELSITDHLTGLFNARHLYRQIRAEAERAARYGRSLALLLLDVDDFKAFNDTHGHQEGDRLLAALGETIKGCIRDSDSAYRYGGEEFVVILPETSAGEAGLLAERLRRRMAETPLPLAGGGQEARTVSIGLAVLRPAESVEDLLLRADREMYRAKGLGKNRVCAGD